MEDFVAGDTRSMLVMHCVEKDTGKAINLADSTVKIKWTNSSNVLVEHDALIVDSAKGIVEYRFQAGDLVAPKLSFELEITNSAGIITSILPINIRIAPKLI